MLHVFNEPFESITAKKNYRVSIILEHSETANLDVFCKKDAC